MTVIIIPKGCDKTINCSNCNRTLMYADHDVKTDRENSYWIECPGGGCGGIVYILEIHEDPSVVASNN